MQLRHFVHESLSRTLRLRDMLADNGAHAASETAQVLAEHLWELTRPETPVTTAATATRAEAEAVLHASGAAQAKGDATDASEDTDNPFGDHDYIVARAADGDPIGATEDTNNPFEGL